MCRVNITGGECPQEEINAYIARGQQLYGREPDAIDVRLDGEYVELAYHYQNQPFDRIRRITGYLVKRSEMEKYNRGEVVLQDNLINGSSNYKLNRLKDRKVRSV